MQAMCQNICLSQSQMTRPKIKQEDLQQETAGDDLSASCRKRLAVIIIIYSTETRVDHLEAGPRWRCTSCAANK